MPTRTTEETIKLALEEMVEGIQIIDQDWRYIYLNTAAALHGRANKDALIGKTMMDCYPGIEATPMFRDLEQVMKDRSTRRVENEFVYEDGRKCWFELFIEPHSSGVLIRSIDITDRKKIEEQLRHSQKLDAIGRLAGGIAHDFNNKLGIMLAFCEMILEPGGVPAGELAEYVEKIHKAVLDSTQLTRQLLAFSRKQVLDPKVADLNAYLNGARESFERLVGETISIEYRLEPKLGAVRVDPTQIDQVLLNLCANARDAMPRGGKLLIETANAELDEAYTRSHPGVDPGAYVLLAVTDNGCGMSRETLDRVFEPFFTTKELGKGTGLGLATVYGIVKQLRGDVWVYSEPEKGTAFKIYFPRCREEAVKDAAVAPRQAQGGGHERILLVEDDLPLREAYANVLRKAGYAVRAARAPSEAESFFFSEPGFDLLLTDVVMPGMSGPELANRLKERQPSLKVVYMSGYTENSITHHGFLDSGAILLQKPISIRKLTETLRRVLDGALTKGIL